MKIAIPTNDGINISAHFGRCRQFLIFEAGNGPVKLIETRANGGCHADAKEHSHAGFVETLGDCQTVLCSGIGAGAVEALRAGGIPVAIVDAAGSAEQIVTDFQAGALRPGSGGMCSCKH
jgi:nitrogen fixation protein NifX